MSRPSLRSFALNFSIVRRVRDARSPHKTLFEIEHLDARPLGVVEDFNKEVPQIHFDARLQFRDRFAVEVVVVLESDLAGMLVDLITSACDGSP